MASDLDAVGIRKANDLFYEALSNLSLGEMDRVWSHGREVRCIHPGWDVLAGWRMIRDSWESIFASSPGLAVEAEEVEISVLGDAAWVMCLERIHNTGEGGDRVSLARATNLFVRAPDGWKIVLHHASPVPEEMDVGATGQVH